MYLQNVDNLNLETVRKLADVNNNLDKYPIYHEHWKLFEELSKLSEKGQMKNTTLSLLTDDVSGESEPVFNDDEIKMVHGYLFSMAPYQSELDLCSLKIVEIANLVHRCCEAKKFDKLIYATNLIDLKLFVNKDERVKSLANLFYYRSKFTKNSEYLEHFELIEIGDPAKFPKKTKISNKTKVKTEPAVPMPSPVQPKNPSAKKVRQILKSKSPAMFKYDPRALKPNFNRKQVTQNAIQNGLHVEKLSRD